VSEANARDRLLEAHLASSAREKSAAVKGQLAHSEHGRLGARAVPSL
jgi:hypothetical protein